MCEYVVVWTCSGYGRIGPECWQHLGCSFSRARTSGATPVLVVLDGLTRLSRATNSVYTEIPGLVAPQTRFTQQDVALQKWNNNITKT
jgi:hypothetical protein